MPTKWLHERANGSKNEHGIGFEGPGVVDVTGAGRNADPTRPDCVGHARPFVGVSQKSIFKRPCQFLAINAHTMAPRTTQWLQERPWNAPTKGLLWIGRRVCYFISHIVFFKSFCISQLSHKSVNLSFPINHPKNKLIYLCGD